MKIKSKKEKLEEQLQKMIDHNNHVILTCKAFSEASVSDAYNKDKEPICGKATRKNQLKYILTNGVDKDLFDNHITTYILAQKCYWEREVEKDMIRKVIKRKTVEKRIEKEKREKIDTYKQAILELEQEGKLSLQK